MQILDFLGMYFDSAVVFVIIIQCANGPQVLQDWSVQDLKIAKTTSKDLFFDPGTIIVFFQNGFLGMFFATFHHILFPEGLVHQGKGTDETPQK